MGNSKAPEISTDHSEDNLNSLTGPVGKDSGQITNKGHLAVIEIVGYILYGVYILGAVVVLINMLIAMMSNTFEDIQKSEDCEWKFARAKLWISFVEQGTTLPIPFNIIPTPKSILKLVRWLKDWVFCGPRKHRSDWQGNRQYDQKYKAIMHRVVLRYIHKMKFEKKGESLKDEILDTREELIFQLHSMYGRLAARLELLEKDVFTLSESRCLAQEEGQGVNFSGLSYSRSVPAHPREGNKNVASRFLADQPRESYLQRRRSCYHDGSRAEFQIAEESRRASILKTRASNSTIPASVGTVDDRICVTSVNTDMTTAIVCSNRNNIGGEKTLAGDERKASGSSIVSLTLAETEDVSCPRADCRNFKNTIDCRTSQTLGGDQLDVTRVSWCDVTRISLCNVDESVIRDSWARDSSSASSRRGQAVIKESSLEEQVNPQDDRQGSPISGVLAGVSPPPSCVTWASHDHPSPHVSCRKHGAYSRTTADSQENASIDGSKNMQHLTMEDVPHASTCRLYTASSLDRLPQDMMKKSQTISNTGTTTSDVENHSFQASHRTKDNSLHENSNKTEGSTDDGGGGTVLQHILQISSGSQKCINMPIMLPVSTRSSRCSPDKSDPFLCTSQSDRHSRNSSPSTGSEKVLRKPERRIGRVDNLYHSEDSARDLPTCVKTESHLVHGEPIFYTRESCGKYSYSNPNEHEDSALEIDSLKRCKSQFGNSKHRELYPQALSATRIVNPITSSSMQMFADDDSIYSRSSSNYNTPCVQKCSSPNKTATLSCSIRDMYERNSDTSFHRNPSPESHPCVSLHHSGTETSGCSSYRRRSPLRKRESLPVISLAGKHRYLYTGYDARPRYSIASVAAGDCLSSSIRGQRPLSPDVFEQFAVPEDDDMTQISEMGSSSMIIPPMATNLVPFPAFIQPKESFVNNLSYSSNTDQKSANDGSKELPKRKTSRSKKTSIVSLVRGRRSNKANKPEIKHNRSVSLSRCNNGSRNEKSRKLQQQRSKEV